MFPLIPSQSQQWKPYVKPEALPFGLTKRTRQSVWLELLFMPWPNLGCPSASHPCHLSGDRNQHGSCLPVRREKKTTGRRKVVTVHRHPKNMLRRSVVANHGSLMENCLQMICGLSSSLVWQRIVTFCSSFLWRFTTYVANRWLWKNTAIVLLPSSLQNFHCCLCQSHFAAASTSILLQQSPAPPPPLF